MGTDAAYYNKLWQEKRLEPDRLCMQERVLKTLRLLFSDVLKASFRGRILDAGSGDGSFVEVCRRGGIDAAGIDICHGIDLEKDALPFNDNEFDIVLMYSVLEHLSNPGNALLEVRRVLKRGARLVIITSNFELDNLLLCERNFFIDPTHIRPYNRRSIRTLMRMYDFKVNFIGLWTVCRSSLIWKLPEALQFYYGAFLPFQGRTKHAPSFLKGRSKSMLTVFEKI